MIGASAITAINACRVAKCESSQWFGIIVLIILLLLALTIIYFIYDHYKNK